jgi:hypothetical protein
VFDQFDLQLKKMHELIAKMKLDMNHNTPNSKTNNMNNSNTSTNSVSSSSSIANSLTSFGHANAKTLMHNYNNSGFVRQIHNHNHHSTHGNHQFNSQHANISNYSGKINSTPI